MNRSRKFARAAATLGLLILVLLGGCRTTPDARPVHLKVVHVNDTHSHLYPFKSPTTGMLEPLGGFARLATVVGQERAGAEPVLLLHGGDSLVGSDSNYLVNGKPDYATLPSYGYRGIDDFDAMNALGFDAMVIGNHELDYGRRWIEGLIGRAKFPVLSADVIRRDLPDLDGSSGKLLARPYVILNRGGLRIGIIGLTTTQYIQSLQVQVKDPVEVARELVPQVARQSDLVLVLSHLGFKPDMELARAVPGIDLIVGGHSHTMVNEPVLIGETLIVQDGAFAPQVGILDLTVAGGKIAQYTYRLKTLDASVPEDAKVKAALDGLLAIGSVGDRPLTGRMFERSSLNSLATSAMLKATDADAALIAADSLSGSLGPGAPSAQQFFNVFWPYHGRGQMPEKDMSERQLIATVGVTDRALRSLARGSDGLRTIVVAAVAPDAFQRWASANEGRSGDPDYVQVDLRLPASGSASPPVRSLVTTIDLALRLERLGLPVDLQRLQITRAELFEDVLAYLASGRP